MQGLCAEGEVAFLKNIPKAIAKEFEGEENGLAQMFGMMGPAFSLNSDFSTDL